MNKLLTATEFSNHRDIGKKPDLNKINECINLAQSVDLYDIMGDFIFELISNKDAVSYGDLMTGSTFTYDDTNYHQEGIKSLLSDFTYARYIYLINTNLTPFGAVTKLSPDSQPIDRNMIRDIVKQTQQDASIKFKFIDKYLLSDTVTFANYSTGNNPDINTFGQKFSIIGK